MAIKRIKYKYVTNAATKAWLTIYEKHVGKVSIGKDAKNVWNSIIKWAFGHEYKLDITKGIGLMGMTGSGKTMTMYVLNDFISIDAMKYKQGSDMVNMRFKMQSAIVIAGDYSREGYDALYRYANYANLCIDDLGAENMSRKHFGDTANVIQEILELRFNKGLLTHFTTNLNEDRIKEAYGDRVYSRLIGNTNILKLNDDDYRINKT